ncbi:hypothetical protein GIB67_041220 [Kingdonia uniflora]|uniref:Protein kinase domain-containing protein n=1 Tax=Kingdonia uniflora TaxID=39325 RepID=A0A7J7NZU5_9MAGN|nr:hypothetical protein GIB67_041220 [Kingdonia uniflora]
MMEFNNGLDALMVLMAMRLKRKLERSILRGLSMIHVKGFIHCDIKLQNILVCGSTEVKIADFGLAKKKNYDFDDGVSGLRGTPLYMSPESVSCNVYETGVDIWALGCVVSELVMGKSSWRCLSDTDINGLLYRIGFGEELQVIPDKLCDDGKDFLIRCFTRDLMMRWTTEMLLNHPFVTLVDSDTSPGSTFDFPE